MKVNTYDELVRSVAQILHRHRNLNLFYRGQSVDHREDEKTSILPSIYRKRNNEKRLMLREKFITLNENVLSLRKLFSEEKLPLTGTSLLNRYPEISWSILQHYEVCDTPLLDITSSLHVACSFAFDRNKSSKGIIYVLGLPWANDPIGYNTYEEIVNIKLLSVCPPQAQRPFFQEGYLAGPFPNYQLEEPKRAYQFDFARRLVAKFEIPIHKDFWGDGFSVIPSSKLYQGFDKVKEICDRLRG